MLTIPYPAINPDIFTLPPFTIGQLTFGPFSLRWYAVAYIAGLIIGWRYCLALARKPPQVAAPQDIDDFLVWATLGVVLGGRIGYVLFYNFLEYLQHPIEILYVWRGGMSFHGGAIGVCLAIFLFCRQRRLPLLSFGDIIACAVPIGLFFGRIANFINDELWGRAAPESWPGAMKFPSELLINRELATKALDGATKIDPALDSPERIVSAYRDNPQIHNLLLSDHYLTPRYPSQLYEAFLEGVVLFVVLWLLQRNGGRQRAGLITGVFLLGYGVARFIVEFFREPDVQLAWLVRDSGLSMGQLLSLPFVIIGLWLVLRALRISRTPATA